MDYVNVDKITLNVDQVVNFQIKNLIKTFHGAKKVRIDLEMEVILNLM